MKINELLKKRPTLSFEIFPPKNNPELQAETGNKRK